MLSRFSVKKPLTVLVAVILILILGVVSYLNMTVDLIPSVNLPYAIISTTFPGASPEEVEQQISGPLEQGMASIDNIDTVTSVSSENVSMVVLRFNEDTNMDTAMIEMRERLDLLENYLPEDAGAPIILKLNPDIVPIMALAVSSEGMDAGEASQYIDDKIIPEIESVYGVASVSASGLVSNLVDVTLSEEKIGKINEDLSAHYREEAEKQIRSSAREEIVRKIDSELSKQRSEALKQTLTEEMADAALKEPKEQAYAALEEEFAKQREGLIAQGLTGEMADAALKGPKEQAISALEEQFRAQKEELMKQTLPADVVDEQIESARRDLYSRVDSQVNAIVDSQLEKLEIPEFAVTSEMISGILQGENFSMPAGTVGSRDGVRYPVRIGDRIGSLEELRSLVITEIPDFKTVTLDDVADIRSFDDADTMYSRVNGDHAVILTLQKQPNISTAEVSHHVEEKISSLGEKDPSLRFTVLMDQGDYVDMMINGIIQNLLLGALFAIVILFLFLRRIRPTLIVGVSILISVITAFVLMYFSGITLNMISMGGLALGVGMLVDNSIVVIENIFRYRREGMSAAKAAVTGAKEVSAAIISSTVTTIVVFVPIIFIKGITRQIFTDMALTIAYSLLASLFVALTVVPAASSAIMRRPIRQKRNIFDRLADGYGKVLGKTLRHSWAVITVSLALLVTSVFAAFSSGAELFPEMDTGSISISVEMPDDYSEGDTFRALDELSEIVTAIPDVDTVGILASGSGSGVMSMLGGGTTVYVQLDKDKSRRTGEVIDEIRTATSGKPYEATVSSGASDISVLTGGQIVYNVYGKDLDSLREAASAVADVIRDTEGATEVDDGLGRPAAEIRITVDKDKAIAQGLTVAQIFMTVRDAIADESVATSLTQDGISYDVTVRDERDEPITDRDLKEIELVAAQDEKEAVSLGDVAEIGPAEGFTSIRHSGQERYVSVSASLKPGFDTGSVNDAVRERVETLELPEGCRAEIGGQGENIRSTFRDMFMMIGLAIAFIYLVMVAQFQSLLSPFIVMFTIPLAFTGAFLGLFAAGMPVSVVSLIGFVLLVGIVVNNGIVFVDYANQQRLKEMSTLDSLVLTGRHRLRPILMTALTTIIALIAMVFDRSAGAEMMRPMAVTTIGGLAYSTLLTLFLVPALYKIFHRGDRHLKRLSSAEEEGGETADRPQQTDEASPAAAEKDVPPSGQEAENEKGDD